MVVGSGSDGGGALPRGTAVWRCFVGGGVSKFAACFGENILLAFTICCIDLFLYSCCVTVFSGALMEVLCLVIFFIGSFFGYPCGGFHQLCLEFPTLIELCGLVERGG
jgi:hypothetical protein